MFNRKTSEEFNLDLRKKNPLIESLEEYKNNNSKIKVRCLSCGYVWNVIPRTILSGHGCSKCAGRIMLSEEEFIRKLYNINPEIKVKGKYKGSQERIEVECTRCGFVWSPVANSLTSQKTGCPKCAGNLRMSETQFLERLSAINPSIIIKGKYVNTHEKTEFECLKCGYTWRTIPGSLLAGTGCPSCAGMLRKSQSKFVDQLNGILPFVTVIGEYKNAHTKIQVRCDICKNEWESKPNNLLHGEGCPICAQRQRVLKQKKTQEDFVKEVHRFNPQIEVLGNYTNAHTKIRCICRNCGNDWYPLAWDLSRGSGCPVCAKTSTSFMEQFLLLSLRQVFGSKEVLSRDKETIGMELDIFIPSKMLAIEPGSWFWHSKKLEKDYAKREECEKHEIRMISVYDAYTETELPFKSDCFVFPNDIGTESNHNSLKKLVYEILRLLGQDSHSLEDKWDIIENEAYIKSRRITTEEFIEKLKTINSQVTVTGLYKGYKRKTECLCNTCGFQWSITPEHLLRGEGCPKCAGHMRKTLEIFKEDLKVKNSRIVLLSEVYVNGVTKVHVKCADCGNEWSARPSNLLSGYGCPACARKRNGKRLSLSQEGFLQRMKEKGNPNVQVIGEYENCKTKILCKCRKCGFEWKATPNSLFQGHGCKMCASSRMQKPK